MNRFWIGITLSGFVLSLGVGCGDKTPQTQEASEPDPTSAEVLPDESPEPQSVEVSGPEPIAKPDDTQTPQAASGDAPAMADPGSFAAANVGVGNKIDPTAEIVASDLEKELLVIDGLVIDIKARIKESDEAARHDLEERLVAVEPLRQKLMRQIGAIRSGSSNTASTSDQAKKMLRRIEEVLGIPAQEKPAPKPQPITHAPVQSATSEAQPDPRKVGQGFSEQLRALELEIKALRKKADEESLAQRIELERRLGNLEPLRRNALEATSQIFRGGPTLDQTREQAEKIFSLIKEQMKTVEGYGAIGSGDFPENVKPDELAFLSFRLGELEVYAAQNQAEGDDRKHIDRLVDESQGLMKTMDEEKEAGIDIALISAKLDGLQSAVGMDQPTGAFNRITPRQQWDTWQADAPRPVVRNPTKDLETRVERVEKNSGESEELTAMIRATREKISAVSNVKRTEKNEALRIATEAVDALEAELKQSAAPSAAP